MIGFKDVDADYVFLCIEIVACLAEQFLEGLGIEKHENINIGFC